MCRRGAVVVEGEGEGEVGGVLEDDPVEEDAEDDDDGGAARDAEEEGSSAARDDAAAARTRPGARRGHRGRVRERASGGAGGDATRDDI